MKNNFLRVIYIAVLCLFCLTLTACEQESIVTSAEIKPTDEFFVNDYADVISEEDEQAIYKKGAHLNNSTSAQVVVVTVDTVGDEDGLKDIAYEGYFTFEVGGIFRDASKRRVYEKENRLAGIPLELKCSAERMLYDLGRTVLGAYGCYEE